MINVREPGLRKKTSVFMQPHYVDNFVQSLFNTISELGVKFNDSTLVLGGDGRYFNRQAIQSIIKIAVAQGYQRVLVAKDGFLSTPAMSAVIRARQASGGLILSSSHNPGGPKEDFGIKYNPQNGGPAPDSVTERVFALTKEILEFKIAEIDDIDLSHLGCRTVGEVR